MVRQAGAPRPWIQLGSAETCRRQSLLCPDASRSWRGAARKVPPTVSGSVGCTRAQSFACASNAVSQRVGGRLGDGSVWLYERGRLDQVISGKKSWADGPRWRGRGLSIGRRRREPARWRGSTAGRGPSELADKLLRPTTELFISWQRLRAPGETLYFILLRILLQRGGIQCPPLVMRQGVCAQLRTWLLSMLQAGGLKGRRRGSEHTIAR